MHNSHYIKIITEAANAMGIDVELLAEDWAIELKRGESTKYIIGYLFPLNDATTCKIANNKNLCSEILSRRNVPNVPHQITFSPSKLVERRKTIGNSGLFENFIFKYGFPFLVKRNNSSKGRGVFLVKNEAEFENILSKLYSIDDAFSLSPFRKEIREYRCIVLDGECLLVYEKQIPFIIGNGISTILELLAAFINDFKGKMNSKKPVFDESMALRFSEIPTKGEKVFMQWQHNRFLGTTYKKITDVRIVDLAIEAAEAIGARFVSVDIIQSEKFGLEVLEINASVVIHSPIISGSEGTQFDGTGKIFQLAIRKAFKI
ncbi:RimK family alpha-L-glutamate ligase [Parasediminibacterium sp. JCM 36343]|uniref:ATP-grasp domain-containing protein n=1 Tax=Parasediminibacterium sp. JCM 36343 TaxID=3374279 RepID=UPI00397A5685